MKKNVASQPVSAQMISTTDGSDVTTGTCNVAVEIDGAAGTGGTATHIANGKWEYVPIQADTNGDYLTFQFVLSGAVTQTVQIYTTFPQTGDSFARLGAPAGASVSADLATIDGNVDSILADTGTDGVVIAAGQTVAAATNVTNGVTLATGSVNAAAIATGAIDADALAADAVAEIADGVWDEAFSGHATAGTFAVAVTDILGDTNEMQPKFGTITDLGSGATLAANLVDIEGQTDDIGAAGAGLNAVPWNAAWDVEVQSEVADALAAIGLDHLLSASVTGTDVADNSVFARLVSSSATADWDDFANTTDSLQSIRNSQIAATDIVSSGAITTSGGAVSSVTNVGTVTGNVNGSVASVTGAVGSVTGAVGSVAGNVDGNVAGSVNSVTSTVSADIVSISGSGPAADKLEAHALTAVPVTFTGGTTSSAVLGTVDGAAASGTDDRYNSRLLVFNAGTLDRVVAQITDYDGVSKTATISTVPTAVTSSHTAILV